MLHELGHLLSGDTIVATAFVTAGLLPKAMHQLYKIAAYIVRHSFLAVSVVQTNRGMLRVNRVNLLGGAVVLLVLGYGLYRIHLLKAVIPVIVFVFLFAVLNRIFRFFALMLSRMAEYRQDKFAYKLGYGEGLRRSLEKLAAGAEPNTGLYYIMMHSSHPIIYNRIRRLEKYLTFD